MVIGNGMIANRFSAYAEKDDWLVFASGVSHSLSVSKEEFQRETNLLREAIAIHSEKKLVYFSTCSIYDRSLQQSDYVLHKLRMEEIIRSTAGAYLIFRVSNPVGKTSNKHTVLNYFVAHIQDERAFTVWKAASRNLIDMDDMYRICERIMEKGLYQNNITNIANPVNYPVTDIIVKIEKHLCKKGHYLLADKGSSPVIDTSAIRPIIDDLQITFDDEYLLHLLEKYFPMP